MAGDIGDTDPYCFYGCKIGHTYFYCGVYTEQKRNAVPECIDMVFHASDVYTGK